MKNWKPIEFNKELGEIAAHAHGCGPQRVTVNGTVDVIVLSPAEYGRLTGEPPAADARSEEGPKVGMFTALRQAWEELADGEDVYWPWDWDCEKREWVLPVDDALSS